MHSFRTLAFAFVLTTAAALGTTSSASAQTQTGLKLGNNPTVLNPSAGLELEFTNKGFLPPALTSTQRDLIAIPAAGLVVYNSTLRCLQMNTGTPVAPVWECLTVGGATNNAGILTEILEGSASPNGASNANGINVTAAQLNQVTPNGTRRAVAGKEAAYNATILSTTTFGTPPTEPQVQAVIDANP
ncbi:MAG: hypothetical protein EOP52_06695 [Sphingobacteriales bacterium]|nr:MAG: hypothetical protein EOP52_06695 [Sphingobacteriales bacterium]